METNKNKKKKQQPIYLGEVYKSEFKTVDGFKLEYSHHGKDKNNIERALYIVVNS